MHLLSLQYALRPSADKKEENRWIMRYVKIDDRIVLRLQRGEEIIASITALCQKEKISLAKISGIGACDRAVIGLYKMDEHHYVKTLMAEDMELVSVNGNVTLSSEDEIYIHCHAAFGTEGGKLVGGHLNEAVVSGTAEIFIDILDGTVKRTVDAETGLNVFDL